MLKYKTNNKDYKKDTKIRRKKIVILNYAIK